MTAAATPDPTNHTAGRLVPLEDGAATVGGLPRARQRPPAIAAPGHWTTPPVPTPATPEPVRADQQPEGRDPVRYGDWEKNGLAIDF